MNIFKECTIYSTGAKVALNLSQAQSICATDYKTAQSVVTYAHSTEGTIDYYVTETYGELIAALKGQKP